MSGFLEMAYGASITEIDALARPLTPRSHTRLPAASPCQLTEPK